MTKTFTYPKYKTGSGFEKRYTLLTGACLLVGFLLLCWPAAKGQGIKVSAQADTNQIRIGEQFKVKLTATVSKGMSVTFPVIPDTLRGLEVVDRSAIDTLKTAEGQPLTLQQQLVLTAFDSGYYVIEPFVFTARTQDGKTDSLSTEAQLVAVKTVQVDTTKDIKDIKAVMEPPFDWHELLPWIIGALAVILVLVIAWFVYRKMQRKPAMPVLIKKPELPAHVTALAALEALEKEKLWQEGRYKEYHIRLTDILRTYIEHRFGVASQESTTDETLTGLRKHRMAQTELARLETVLRLADLVKFAKAIPVINENEQSMSDARTFIQATAAKPETDKEATV